MKQFTEKQYHNYMRIVKSNIEETERRMSNLDRLKEISKMSFDEWCTFQSTYVSGINYESN